MSYGVTYRGNIVKSGFATEQEANRWRVTYTKGVDTGLRYTVKTVTLPDPTPIVEGKGYQVYTIARGGGKTPQTLSVVKTFGTEREAEIYAEAERREFADRDTPVGIRQTPTVEQEAAFERHNGQQITGPAPKGKATTRTAEEQTRIEEKHRELTAKNLEETYGKEVAETYLARTKPTYKEVTVQEREEVVMAYGGRTKDATLEQIAKAKKEGGDYYIGGVRYSFDPKYTPTHYFTPKAYAVVEPAIAGVSISSAFVGEPTKPTILKPTTFDPSIHQREQITIDLGFTKTIGERVQTPTEIARSYYADKPFQVYGAWFTAGKPKPTIEPTVTPVTPHRQFLEDWAIKIRRRERGFFESEGFQRIEKLVTAKSDITKRYVSGLMGWSIALGGAIPMVAEKIGWVYMATDIRKGETKPEVTWKTLKEEHYRIMPYVAEVYKDPVTYMTAGTFALPTAAAIMLGKKTTGISVGKVKVRGAKPRTAAKVLKSIAEEQTLIIKGKQYYAKPIIEWGLKTTIGVKTPDMPPVVKPSSLITSKYVTETLKPTISVARTVPYKYKTVKMTPPELIKALAEERQITFRGGARLPPNIYGWIMRATEFERGVKPRIDISAKLLGEKVEPFKLSQYQKTLFHELKHFEKPLMPESIVRRVTPTTPLGYFFKVKVPKPLKSETTFITTPYGTQYTTTLTKVNNIRYVVRTITEPSGKAKAIVYTWGLKPIHTFEYKATPTFKLLEPLKVAGKKESLSMPELRRETVSKITRAGVVSAAEGYKVTGLRLRGTKDILQTVTEKPRVEVRGDIVYDFMTGARGIKPTYFDIGGTKYKYVDYLPKQPKYTITTGEFGIVIKRPTISKTLQKSIVKEPFMVKIFKSKKGTAGLLPQLFQQKPASQKPIFETIKIQRPKVIQEFKGVMDIYLPPSKISLPKSVGISIPIGVGISLLGAEVSRAFSPISETRQGFLPISETRQGLIPISEIKQELIPTSKIRQEFLPKTEIKQELISKQIVEQQTVPQSVLQESFKGLDIITERTHATTLRPLPTPIILIPSKQQKINKLLLAAAKKEQAYDVYIREGEKRADKFKKVASDLPINRALRRGKTITDNYIEASFRLKISKAKSKIADILAEPDLSKFRRPRGKTKLPSDTYVEKAKYRIDTIGEKQQLSYFREKKKQLLGLISQKKKQQLAGLISTKKNNNLLKSKKKRKGVAKWL